MDGEATVRSERPADRGPSTATVIRVELYDDAEREAAAISQRYEDEQSGLGDEFLAHLDVALGEIADHPRAAAIWRHCALSVEVRRHVMRRFP